MANNMNKQPNIPMQGGPTGVKIPKPAGLPMKRPPAPGGGPVRTTRPLPVPHNFLQLQQRANQAPAQQAQQAQTQAAQQNPSELQYMRTQMAQAAPTSNLRNQVTNKRAQGDLAVMDSLKRAFSRSM